MKYSLIAILAAAVVFSAGCSSDDSTTAPSTPKVATPMFDPAGGTYGSVQHVKISCATAGADVYYDTTGVDPGETSPFLPPGDSILVTHTMTIKARAMKEGMNSSEVASATYTMNLPDTVATPVFDPPGGAYASLQHVQISCATPGADIYYDTDGLDPDETSTLLPPGGSIEVAGNMTIKARAFKEGMHSSKVASAAYTVDLIDVAAPYFEPDPGLFGGPTDVIIHCVTQSARIFYTTDGTDPDTNSTEFIFQTVIPVSSTTTIRTRAYKYGMDPSPVIGGDFIIIPGLIAYYPFNGTPNDESGNDHIGTLHGATLVADRFGTANSAYQFDGVNDYIELSDESAFDLTEFTISFWTYYSVLPPVPAPSTPAYYCAVSKSGVNIGNFTVRLAKSGGASYCYLSYAHATSGGNWNTSCYENIYTNRYYHIVVTVSDEARTYVNGTLQCTSTSMPTPVQNDGNVMIGKFDSQTTPWYFNGIIDDVRFYNRALTSSEVQTLYQAEGNQ